MRLWEAGSICDDGFHLVLGLYLPQLALGRKNKNIFQEQQIDSHIKLPTEIVFNIGEVYKYFGFSILGFGIYFSIQTGY